MLEYRYTDAIPARYYRGKLHSDWANPLAYPHFYVDQDRDWLISRAQVGAYHMGKYPDDDPIILEVLRWCWDAKSYPKIHILPEPEEAADVLLRFQHKSQRDRCREAFANADAVYALGSDAMLWLVENTPDWQWINGKINIANPDAALSFIEAFPSLVLRVHA